MIKFVPNEFLLQEYKKSNIKDTDKLIKLFLLECIGDTPYKLKKFDQGYEVTFNEWEVV